MSTPEERRTVGGALRQLRTAANLDTIQLGARASVSASHIRNVENGDKTLTPRFAAALDEALGAGGVLTDLASTRDPMRRRSLLHSVALMTMGPALASAPGVARVGDADIEVIRTMAASLRGLDNRLGGGTVRDVATRYLAKEARPLLGGAMTPAIRSQLLSVLAELAQLAGWTCYDTGMHGPARQHLVLAQEWAAEAKDLPLAAELLAALAHQAAYLGRGEEAVRLAEQALKTAEAAGVAAIAAEAAVMAAHGYGLLGDGPRAARRMMSAEHHLDRADRSDDPTWIGYMGPAYLAALRGHALVALSDPAAVRAAEESLDMDTNQFVRGQAFNLVLLAVALSNAGRPEEAAARGRAALNLGGGLRSARLDEYLRRLAVSLARHSELPAVADLIADIGERLSPAEAIE